MKGTVAIGVEIWVVIGTCGFKDGFDPKFMKGFDLESAELLFE